jgi:hypothetical protein
MKRLRTLVLSAVAGTFVLLLAAPPALAAAGPPSPTPATFTPYLLTTPVSQNVQQLVPCGSLMYAVGTISRVGQGTATYTRGNAFSFNASTGAMTTWDPQANGLVHSIAFSPDCGTAYLGGDFTSVHGTAATNIAAVDTTTGAVRTAFARNADDEVDTLQYTSHGLLVGGLFNSINGVARGKLASLDPATGAVTAYTTLKISGNYQETLGGATVFNSQLNPGKTKLLIQGIFTTIGGTSREQAAVLDLGASTLTLNGWSSTEFNGDCSPQRFYIRAGAWSPDGNTIYTASTGYKPLSGAGSSTSQPRAGLCDSVAAWPATSGPVSHTWINYTGCDSLYSVAADAGAVYIGGHERWADNPNGCDAAGPGSVARPGLAAISPTTGKALSWNPTRSLGFGAQDIEITPAGVWVASDTFSDGLAQNCGGQTKHGGICFLPY